MELLYFMCGVIVGLIILDISISIKLRKRKGIKK